MRQRNFKFVEKLLIRIGLFVAASYGFYTGLTQWESAGDALHPAIVVLGLLTYIATFGMLFVAVTGIRLKYAARFIPVFYILSLLIQAYLRFDAQPFTYGTDSAAFEQSAAAYFLQGENPYTINLLPSLNEFRMPPVFRTPLVDGSYQSQIPYPALSFLLFIPFLTAGIADARIILLVYHILLLVLVYFAAPRLIKPVVLVPFFATPEVIAYTLGTVTDMPWVFYLTAAAILWKHRDGSALLYGIALSIKHHPWLLLPFLAVRLWKETEGLARPERINRVVRYFGISELVFLGVNAPFILQAPDAWFNGVLSPPLGNLIVYGQGLSTLSQVGLIYAPRFFYSASALLVAAALLTIYWNHFHRLSDVIWLFPAVILWFPYRSLQSYFIYWIPLLLVSLYPMIKSWQRGDRRTVRQRAPSSRLRRSVSIGAVSVAVGFVAGGIALFGLFGKPTYQVSIQRALLDPQTNRVRQLEVTVTNDSVEILNPIFWVKQAGRQSLRWEIVTGPTVLAGSAQAKYLIQAGALEFEVPNSQSLAVAVNNSGNSDTTSYSSALSVDLASHASLINPDFFYWTLASARQVEQPYGWGFYQMGNSDARRGYIANSQVEGKRCVALWTTQSVPGSLAWLGSYLDQWVEFPDYKIRLPVYPTFRSSTDETPNKVFGVEVRDDAQQLWYIFTDAEERMWQDPNNPSVAFRLINSPINQWSEQTIDIASDYDTLRWDLPQERVITQDGQTSIRRMVNFRIFLGSSSSEQGTLAGCFGPIIQHLR